jgi:3-oxoacyl-[acyl-carrier-protein] synthase-1
MYALAGGADALCRFTLNGFNSLMILDKDLSNPMDNRRRCLNLGESCLPHLGIGNQCNRKRRNNPWLCKWLWQYQ